VEWWDSGWEESRWGSSSRGGGFGREYVSVERNTEKGVKDKDNASNQLEEGICDTTSVIEKKLKGQNRGK